MPQKLEFQGTWASNCFLASEKELMSKPAPEKKKDKKRWFFKKSKKEEDFLISEPMDFKQTQHVYLGEAGLQGLPPEWTARLKKGGVSDKDIAEHKEVCGQIAKIEVDQGAKSRLCNAKSEEKEEVIDLKSFTTQSDPDENYENLAKMENGDEDEYMATRKSDGLEVSLRRIGVTDKNKKVIVREVSVLKKCSNENILKYVECYLINDMLWLVTELMDFGELTNLIDLHQSLPMLEMHIAYVMDHLVDALCYIHSIGYIHRDIKSDNLLVKKDGIIKLANFGSVAFVDEKHPTRNSVIGTPFWMSPELIRSMDYGNKVDTWSLGVTCFECAHGAPPYIDLPPMKAMLQITTKGMPDLEGQWSDNFKKFFGDCCQSDVEKRPTETQLKNYEFLKEKCTKEEFADLVKKAVVLVDEEKDDDGLPTNEEQEKQEI
ncbi:serine/threonine protein kinase, putative [Entamoeba invadens IP1]|uniref:Serine/threonine protein kinase, putative n=1 Tax=Entamoeba invadens IP1 TaxID=370355 RepID=L7FMF3_ENTIV|nr:serine/threonine protein kinase, putative [Entamoeba invadens IP1]ELP91583.1 serine/threonine protein kinase, putative [Entamoeba invadens IP1]|eukprot:XP_004258354.1 serine/threonine protein kinase, putative [Entamoeba invadens IP1]